MIQNCRVVCCKRIAGKQGALTAIEGGEDVPFEIRRVYYINNVPEDAERGFHAHRGLEQVLLCLNGSVSITVKTPYEEQVFLLRENSAGLYIGNMVWREMREFTPGAVLMVLASEHYRESDYIREYPAYLEEAKRYFQGKEEDGA